MGLLTPEEESAILSTWALVAKDLKGNGTQFFIHFFKGYPQYQSKFKGFANVPMDQLAGNKRLQAHGFTVLNSINGLIENLGDAEVLVELLITNGRNHARRGVVPGDLENLKASMLDFFSRALGGAWTKDAEEAWTKVLTVVVAKFCEGLTSES